MPLQHISHLRILTLRIAIELVHEIAEYLSRRYPTTFKISRHSNAIISNYGWEGAQPIQTITIVPLNVSYDLPLSVDEPGAAVRALEVAALMYKSPVLISNRLSNVYCGQYPRRFSIDGRRFVKIYAIDELLQLLCACRFGRKVLFPSRSYMRTR